MSAGGFRSDPSLSLQLPYGTLMNYDNNIKEQAREIWVQNRNAIWETVSDLTLLAFFKNVKAASELLSQITFVLLTWIFLTWAMSCLQLFFCSSRLLSQSITGTSSFQRCIWPCPFRPFGRLIRNGSSLRYWGQAVSFLSPDLLYFWAPLSSSPSLSLLKVAGLAIFYYYGFLLVLAKHGHIIFWSGNETREYRKTDWSIQKPNGNCDAYLLR